MIFLHLGGGAGDLDERSNYQCGFTKFIKENIQNEDKAFIIEANSKNIQKLSKCWQKFPNVKILNIAIVDNDTVEKKIKFYFADEDAPHYHVCSIDIKHVKKYYPNSNIKEFEIQCVTIHELLEKLNIKIVEYLSIDIEGIDLKLLMSIDLNKYKINNISIEYLHLSKKEKFILIKHLEKFGYSYCGFGYDHNNYDFLFKKKKIFLNRLFANVLFLISNKHLKFFNKIIQKR